MNLPNCLAVHSGRAPRQSAPTHRRHSARIVEGFHPTELIWNLSSGLKRIASYRSEILTSLVELRGFEPLTSSMPLTRSPN